MTETHIFSRKSGPLDLSFARKLTPALRRPPPAITMKPSAIYKLSAVLLFILISFESAAGALGSQRTEEAYVTLLYGDEFLLGVRVLGKSIRDTGSTKDMVALVSDGVSEYAQKLLQADGWIVQHISLLENPNKVRPKRFWGVYTKLKIFSLTKYKKVVYLDADTIVVKSVEDLFKCGKFCANLKHSERLNSGVMVVEPSAELFNDMMAKVKTLSSYTGGDQGFLNSYYSGFASAHVFEPNLSSDVRNPRPVPEMERLSTLYNADVGLYMLANKWMVDEKELRVIHYTLGPLKPWDWWTSWLLKPVDVWQDVRVQLEESLPGTRGGKNPNDDLVIKFLYLFPIFAVFFCCYRSLLQMRDSFGTLNRSSLYDNVRHLYYKFRSCGALSYSSVPSSLVNNSNQQLSTGVQFKVPIYLGGASIFVCFVAAVVAFVLALAVIPHQVMPWTGLILMYEWTFTIFFALFGGYLYLLYLWGKMIATQGSLSSPPDADYGSGKGHQRQVSNCDFALWFYWFGMGFLAIAVPALPGLFGITALFLRLGLMVAGGFVLASFMTYASEHLSIRSFLKGLEDGDTTRVRNACFLC